MNISKLINKVTVVRIKAQLVILTDLLNSNPI